MSRTAKPEGFDGPIDEAITWHVRLQSGGATEEDWVEFTAWLEADPAHETAYRQVEALSEEVIAAQDEIRARLIEEKLPPAAKIITLRRRWRRPDLGTWQTAALGGAAAGLLIAAVLWLLWPQEPAELAYATGLGERRTIALGDETRVELNTQTRLIVVIGTEERRVRLERGEALFNVGRDPDRPFIVSAGSRSVRVVGTRFNVARQRDEIRVTVGEGIVLVEPAPGAVVRPGEEAARLTAGQQFYQRDPSSPPQITEVNPQAVFAWTEDRLVFDDAPLSEVVKELNRYFTIPVEIGDESIAGLRFSGILMIDDQPAVLKRLQEFLPIAAEEAEDKIILRAPRAEE